MSKAKVEFLGWEDPPKKIQADPHEHLKPLVSDLKAVPMRWAKLTLDPPNLVYKIPRGWGPFDPFVFQATSRAAAPGFFYVRYLGEQNAVGANTVEQKVQCRSCNQDVGYPCVSNGYYAEKQTTTHIRRIEDYEKLTEE